MFIMATKADFRRNSGPMIKNIGKVRKAYMKKIVSQMSIYEWNIAQISYNLLKKDHNVS